MEVTFIEYIFCYCCSNKKTKKKDKTWLLALWVATDKKVIGGGGCLRSLLPTYLLKLCDLSPMRKGENSCHFTIFYLIFT